MTTTTVPRPRPTPSRPSPAGPGGGLLGALDDRRQALAGVGPNWFATVMGTSIVATAAVDLPVQVPEQRVLGQVVWVPAGLLLTAVGAATVGHWVRFPDPGPPARRRSGDGERLRRCADGVAGLRGGDPGRWGGSDRGRRRGRCRLGAVAAENGAGAGLRGRRAVPGLHPARRARGRRVRRLADVGGAAVTGTSALAITTGTDLFRVAAAVFFIGLLAAWITVAARTTYGTWTGELLR
jgi:hypothetical protein